MLQKVDFLVTDTITRLIIEDAVSSNTGPTWCLDGYSSVEACVRGIFHVWPVAESLIFQKVVDDMDFTSVFVVLIGPFICFGDVDGMLANGKASVQAVSLAFCSALSMIIMDSPWNDGVAQPKLLSMPTVMRSCRFCKHISILLVEEEDHATLRVQTKCSELAKCCDGGIWSQFGLMPCGSCGIVEIYERRIGT